MRGDHRCLVQARPSTFLTECVSWRLASCRSRGRLLLVLLVVLMLVLSLSACKPTPPALDATKEALKGSVGGTVSIRGYNFTADGVQDFYADGAWGANLPPYGGGGKSTCCVMLPPWYEGLSVTVDWTIGRYTVPYDQRKHLSFDEQGRYWSARTLRQTVPVQRYDHADTLQVFFLPGDKLEVWVYDAGPQNPGHPSKRGYPVNPNPPQPGSTDLP